ncbi:MAG: FAD binding domain-containing protein [Bacteroidota bacterium]
MKNIKWEYPEQINEALDLIKDDKAVLHGGGNHLVGNRLRDGDRIVFLGKLPLNYVKKEENSIKIGSLTDYNTVAERLNEIEPGHILAKSLGQSATIPIRNRVTIGGSLRLAPNWSDLIGPLIALEAKVKLEGANSGVYPVMEYLTQKDLKSKTLVTEVVVPDTSWESWYYREGMTKNDHPGFTITVLAKRKKNVLENIAIVLTGHTDRFMRVSAIEDQLKGKDISQLDLHDIAKGLDIKFVSAKGMSSDYVKHLAETQIERGLIELLKS